MYFRCELIIHGSNLKNKTKHILSDNLEIRFIQNFYEMENKIKF